MYGSYYLPSKALAEYEYCPSDEERYGSKLQVAHWIAHTSREEPIHPYMPAFDENEPWKSYYRYLPQRKQWPEIEIAQWVDQTLESPLANPFTPKTPRSLTPSQAEIQPLPGNDQHSPSLQMQSQAMYPTNHPAIKTYAYSRPFNGIPHGQQDQSHAAIKTYTSYPIPSARPRSPNGDQDINTSDSDEISSTDTEIGVSSVNVRNIPSSLNALEPSFLSVMPPNQPHIEDQHIEQETPFFQQSEYVNQPAVQSYTYPSTVVPHTALVSVQDRHSPNSQYSDAPPQALPSAYVLSPPQSSAYTSIYSYPSSRTESTDYGMFYTRMALSQDSNDL